MSKDDDANKLQILSINDIQDKVSNGEIELPPIQRGFVWKPYQIENLWDSILRGFPIGSFICKKNTKGAVEILDGQQRLTSILLGLNWKGKEESKYAKRIIEMQKLELKIFLDTKENKQDKEDHRKYNTRVITKYHPWGYQKSPNNTILSYADIRSAMDSIQDRMPNEKRIFMANDTGNVYINNEKRQLFFEYGFPYKIDGNYLELSTIKEKDVFYEVYNKALSRATIPFLFIEENIGQTDYIPNSKDDLDSTEYLLTLINRGGTRISNDDLNYSVIKNELMKDIDNGRDIIERIDLACKNSGISPSRFIMICYFLYKTKTQKNKSISLYISPTQFKKEIQNENASADFLAYIKETIEISDEKYSVPLIGKAKKIITYNKSNNKEGIPYIWFLTILRHYMPLAFLILYLVKKYDEKTLKNKIIQLITTLYLFDYKKYQRNPLRKLVEIFVGYSENEDLISAINRFWKDETVNNIMTIPFSIDEINKDENIDFVKKSKALLIYAQREFLTEEFENEQFTLEDMDIPFDYDHIFPKCYKGRKDNKYWDSIGNLRAWPYDKNRHDSKKLPKDKFTDIDFINSFCENLKKRIIDVNELKDDSMDKKAAASIIKDRICSIYEEWYDTNNIKNFVSGNIENE